MTKATAAAFTLALLASAPVHAVEDAQVTRIDSGHVAIAWRDSDPVTITAADPTGPATVMDITKPNRSGRIVVAAPVEKRQVFTLKDGGDGSSVQVAERVLPLEQGSNFRDAGGRKTVDGKTVRWGMIYRSGAMPLLTERDYRVLEGLNIRTIVDLRSVDERMIAPTMLDDRTGATFLSNDYSMKPMLARFAQSDGEYLYGNMGNLLTPQFRAIFRSLLKGEGPVLYHCSAGQDRTGIATALILSALGVDRKTIIEDYHLSTELRRPQYEMPKLDPADWPGNPIVPLYVAGANKPGGPKAEPLFTPKGHSHMAQLFETIDREYGGVENYLARELGISAEDLTTLRAMYLL